METEVFGTAGAIRVNAEPYEDRILTSDCNGFHRKGFEWFYAYWEKTYASEIRHFTECVLQNKQPLVGLEDGCKTVEWAYAANQALQERKVVHVID